MYNKNYLVVGAGASGIAATGLLYKKELPFVLYDGNKDLDIASLRQKHSHLSHARIIKGEIPDDIKEWCDIVILSPGVPADLPFVNELRDSGREISGEIELAYRLGRGRVCAITGTNGKTTTTSLVGEIMSMAFTDTRVVGNIGIPYTSVAADTTDETVIVAEISSFQLETAHTFAPKVSAILNITPDHLDRHHTMEAYIAAKESVTKNQTEDDYCILNYDDEVLREFGTRLRPEVIWFSSGERLDNGVYYHDGSIYMSRDGDTQKVINTNELQILGIHNYENAAAAIAMCHAFGISLDVIRKGLREFVAVAHRIEYICERNGIRFYNDSKGTNPDAAIKAVEAMTRPTCLIGGGYDKSASYDRWIKSFKGRVKLLALIGQTKKAIEACARENGFSDVICCDSLEEAIDKCYEAADDGDAILLSPACASWDMFTNYEERGKVFADYARSLS